MMVPEVMKRASIWAKHQLKVKKKKKKKKHPRWVGSGGGMKNGNFKKCI